MRHFAATFRYAILFALLAFGRNDLQVLGQSDAEKGFSGPVAGKVVDSAKSPVAGCKVYDDPVVLAETVTDGEGRFRFSTVKYNRFEPMSQPPWLIARDPKGRLGGATRFMGDIGENELDNIQIALVDVRDYRGRLTDTSGRPIPKIDIKPKVLAISYNKALGSERPIELILSADFSREMAAETAADGSFVVHGAPAQGRMMAKIHAPGFGASNISWTLDKPVDIQLEPSTELTVSISPADPDVIAGVKFEIRSANPQQDTGKTDFTVYYYATNVSADKDGKFHFQDVTPGQCRIWAETDAKLPYLAESIEPFDLKSGKAAKEMSIALQRAVRVQGKVVDKQSGDGVNNVILVIMHVNADGLITWEKGTITDANGNYIVNVKPGKIKIQSEQVPEEYMPPYIDGKLPEYNAEKDTALPPIQLERAAPLEGIIVDKSGKPIANAEIHAMHLISGMSRNHVKLHADQDGKFIIKQVPKQGTALRIKSGTAVSDGGVVVNTVDSKEPVRVVISDKNAFAIRGMLIDDAGQPIKDAPVDLWSYWSGGSWSIGSRTDSCTSDAQGKFEFAALWPGDRYHLMIAPEGFDKYESEQMTGKAGQIQDLSKITLNSAKGYVEGVAADSAGKPLAGVRVFNSGDAADLVSTVTDESGRFRLQGFKTGPVYVFAEKPGYRFTGVLATSGASDVALKILRKDEPAPPWRLSVKPISADEQREIARKFFERLWTSGNYDKSKLGTAIAAMARIDPQQARKWSAELKGASKGSINRILAEYIADSDLDEALDLIGQDAYALQNLAQRFLKSDPAKAMRCAEALAVCARAINQPERAIYLASAGSLAYRLGNKQSGQKLLDEAAEMIAKTATDGRSAYYRGLVAEALAVSDLNKALALADSITDSRERQRHLVNIAEIICLDDLDKALSIVDKNDAQDASRMYMHIAYRLADAGRTEEALRLVENMKSDYGSEGKYQAEALGWMAVAVAPRDKNLAYSLIDRALALCLDKPESFRSWSNFGGRAATAAFIAVQANDIGYPDMESVINRVLACRLNNKDEDSPVRRLASNIIMAKYLALVDPGTARRILQSSESQSSFIVSGGIARYESWFQAWVLADPIHAMEIIDRELQGAKDKPSSDLMQRLILQAVELLTVSQHERLKKISLNMAMWFPGEE
ncbi:MAG: hypothetical protein ABSG67_10465 [Thermoguttaceae bacterium]